MKKIFLGVSSIVVLSALTGAAQASATFAVCAITSAGVSSGADYHVNGHSRPVILDDTHARQIHIAFVRKTDGFQDYMLMMLHASHGPKGLEVTAEGGRWASNEKALVQNIDSTNLSVSVKGVTAVVMCEDRVLNYAFVNTGAEHNGFNDSLSVFTVATFDEAASLEAFLQVVLLDHVLGGTCVAGDVNAAYAALLASPEKFTKSATLKVLPGNAGLSFRQDKFLRCDKWVFNPHSHENDCVDEVYEKDGTEVVVPACSG